MGLLKYLPRIMILPTTLATVIGLVQGHVPTFIVWIMVGASILLVLLMAVSRGLRHDTKLVLFWIRDRLNDLQAALFRTVKGKDQAEILRLKELIKENGELAEEAKLQGDEDGYLALRAVTRCLSRACDALGKMQRQAAKDYELAASYHKNDYDSHSQAIKANHQGNRQMKWLCQAASHNWGNVAHYQAKVALATEENNNDRSVKYKQRVEKFKVAASYYQRAAAAFAKDDLKLAASLEEKAEECSAKAKQLQN